MITREKIMLNRQVQLARDLAKALVRKKGRNARFMRLFVYLPTVLLFVYLTCFFSSMYISESHFALRSNDGGMDMPSGPSLLFQAVSSTFLDSYVVQEYILSMDMLEEIEKRIDIRAHYADRSRDIYSRLWKTPSREEMLEYWRWVTSVTFEQDKGIITVQVKAYTPETAKAINDVILECSEALVNRMNDRAHQDTLRLTKEETIIAEQRLIRARAALQIFRDDKSVLDPKATAASLGEVLTRLEGEAAATQAELTATLQTMHKNSPRVQVIETKLRALQEQISREKARLAGISGSNGSLSSLVGDYANLLAEEKFAEEMHIKAMASYETARIKAIAQSRYIVPFQRPTLPQESLYPRPFLFTAFGFVAFLLILGICSLIVAAIRDHMGV